MKCELVCWKCGKRWRNEGAMPWRALAAHRATAHPDEQVGRSPLDADAIVDVGDNDAPAEVALPSVTR